MALIKFLLLLIFKHDGGIETNVPMLPMKWESTLNLRVHAHGYDVELIMKAPCNDNYPLGINLSCNYDWIPCDHGSDHDVLLRFHFANNLEHLSSTSQRSSTDSILFHFREFNPLGI